MNYGMMAVQGLKFLQQKKLENEAYVEQQDLYNRNRLAAAQARDLKIQQLNAQAFQTAEVYTQRKQQTAIQALKAQEAAVVRATYEGNNLDLQLLDVEAQKLRADTAYSEQNTIDQKNISYQRMGLDGEMNNRINSVQQGKKPPSFGMTMLEGAATMYAADYEFNDSKLFGTIFASGSDATGANTSALPAVGDIS